MAWLEMSGMLGEGSVFGKTSADAGRKSNVENCIIGVKGAFVEGGGVGVVDDGDGEIVKNGIEGLFEAEIVPGEVAVFYFGGVDGAWDGDGDMLNVLEGEVTKGFF